MKPIIRLSMGIALLMSACSAAFAQPQDKNSAPAKTTLYVGVYDSRAIAVAYAPSKYNPAGSKIKEYNEAKADGDTKRAKELEAWGEKHQRQLHRQGFGRVPVNNLLAHVKDKLPEVASKAGIDVIARQCDYTSQNVEVVDITKKLVLLFDPSEKTLKIVEELKKHAPVDLDVIEKHHKH